MSGEKCAEGGEREGQGFEIQGRSLFSRAVRFAVPGLGSFGWRYAGSKERAGTGADSLLVCEVFLPGTPTDSDSQEYRDVETSLSSSATPKRPSEQARRDGYRSKKGSGEASAATPHRIAQLVRNSTFRSPGTTRSTAGNGGRLQLDLRIFDEKVRERVEWLVVTTAITMLKREVDRRRTQQAAAFAVLLS